VEVHHVGRIGVRAASAEITRVIPNTTGVEAYAKTRRRRVTSTPSMVSVTVAGPRLATIARTSQSDRSASAVARSRRWYSIPPDAAGSTC